MANTITDNRTKLFTGDSTTADSGGDWLFSSTSEVLDTSTFIEGTGSIADQMSDSRRTLIWNDGTTYDMTDQVFYIWVNCGVVGLLESFANDGFCVRFTGPSATNYFEVTVGGNDNWPIAIAGGWVQFVVDVNLAQASPDLTGGTPPAITAIQGFGISAICTAMTKVSDNCWVDAGYTLAKGTPGVIIQGRNGGSTDWTWANALTQLGVGSGALKAGPSGTYMLNTSVQFGVNDTVTHGFTDTNSVVLFDEQPWMDTDQYFMQALGNSGGTTRVIMGVKTGTGDTATGAQGCTFLGTPGDPNRCDWDFNDPNLDDIGFYGCTFSHQGAFLLDDPAVSSISSSYIDCSSALISDCRDFLKNKIINAATADGVAFITTNDLADMVLNAFEFSDGHAVELVTTPSKVTAQEDVGNSYSGYGATGSNDAEYYNNTGAGLVTINVSAPGNGQDYRNGTSATTTVVTAVTVSITDVIANTQLAVFTTADLELYNEEVVPTSRFWWERFEAAGYDETWSEGETTSGGGTIDSDFATTSITGEPDRWQDLALQISATIAESAYVQNNFGADEPTVYASVDTILDSHSLATTNQATFLSLFDNAGNLLVELAWYNDAGDLRIQADIRFDDTQNLFTSDAILALDTRYTVEVEWDTVGNNWGWRITDYSRDADGALVGPVTQDSGATLTSIREVRRIRAGGIAGSIENTVIYYLDRIALDDTGFTYQRVSLEDVSFSTNYTGDQAIRVELRKAQLAPKYVDRSIPGTITSTGFAVAANQQLDNIAAT